VAIYLFVPELGSSVVGVTSVVLLMAIQVVGFDRKAERVALFVEWIEEVEEWTVLNKVELVVDTLEVGN